MSYEEILDYLFEKLPIYQRKGRAAYKASIGNIIYATKYLDNPHLKFKSVHIAGTNGKGSTAHMIASIMQEADYKVGMYTSPHLKDFRERIKINGEMIPKNTVTDFVQKNINMLEELDLSFFEMTVSMAFDYFAKEKVDIAIIETGLGGRLDSTNIITPELSVITNISIDHTNLLGDNIKDITKEKAGIIKDKIPVVVGRRQDETKDIFNKTAKTKNTSILYASNIYKYKSDLQGNYQRENINLSVCAIKQLKRQGWKISDLNIINGLKNCTSNTKIKGRWQIMKEKPMTICDTGHNIDAILKTTKEISKIKYENLHFIFGITKDKNLKPILSVLPKKAIYYFCKPNIERGLDVDILHQESVKHKLNGNKYPNVKSAFIDAQNNAKEEDLIFISGSTFLVAEII